MTPLTRTLFPSSRVVYLDVDDDDENRAEQVLYPLVAALGLGCLFQVPLIALQAAMPLKDGHEHVDFWILKVRCFFADYTRQLERTS